MPSNREKTSFYFKCVLLCLGAGISTSALAQTQPLANNNILSRVQAEMDAQELTAKTKLAKMMTREAREQELSVNTRQNPEFDPSGVRAADFNIFPSISTGIEYLDNVFYTAHHAVSDAIYTVQPELKMISDFEQNQLSSDFHASSGTYQDRRHEDFIDYGVNVGGRLDMGDTSIPLGLTYDRSHEERSSPEDRFGVEPTKFNLLTGKTGVSFADKIISVSAGTAFSNYDFTNDQGKNGIIISNKDRNRTEFGNSLSLGILPLGYFSPFIYGRSTTIRYEVTQDSFGEDRDSQSEEGGLGVKFDLTGVTSSSINIGYIHRNIADQRFPDINALSYAASINWEPSTLLSLTLDGGRTIEESRLVQYSASLDSTVALSANYELTPAVFLKPQISFLNRTYKGSGNAAVEELQYGGDLVYKVNRNAWLQLSGDRSSQSPSGNKQDFTSFKSDIVQLTIKFQL